MTGRLTAFLTRELEVAVPAETETVAARVAEELGGVAVLFYGSVLRTGDSGGVLDFYVLTPGLRGTMLRRAGMRWLWPDVSFHEIAVGGRTLRVKVATMPLDAFARACRGESIDTTIWARFVQPAALVWRDGPTTGARVVGAVAAAAVTAARFAAALGPDRGAALDYWAALFTHTYTAELRVEPAGREREILRVDPKRYETLLTMAWEAGGIGYDERDGVVAPRIDAAQVRAVRAAWRRRARLGKPLNAARLVKATFTFDGAARYGAWKLARHTGIAVPLTAFRERHPILAAPGILWDVLRARSS